MGTSFRTPAKVMEVVTWYLGETRASVFCSTVVPVTVRYHHPRPPKTPSRRHINKYNNNFFFPTLPLNEPTATPGGSINQSSHPKRTHFSLRPHPDHLDRNYSHTTLPSVHSPRLFLSCALSFFPFDEQQAEQKLGRSHSGPGVCCRACRPLARQSTHLPTLRKRGAP
jgi:hypothetical protein